MTIRAPRRSVVRELDYHVGTTHIIGLSGNSAIVPTALGLAIGFAALIRIAHLGTKSIWSDEAFSIAVAKLPWADFGHVVTTGEANMSFYYFLLRPWVRFGDDAAYVRLLSVLAGVAVIPVIYWIGREALSHQGGIFAAFTAFGECISHQVFPGGSQLQFGCSVSCSFVPVVLPLHQGTRTFLGHVPCAFLRTRSICALFCSVGSVRPDRFLGISPETRTPCPQAGSALLHRRCSGGTSVVVRSA